MISSWPHEFTNTWQFALISFALTTDLFKLLLLVVRGQHQKKHFIPFDIFKIPYPNQEFTTMEFRSVQAWQMNMINDLK